MNDTEQLKFKRWPRIYYANTDQKVVGKSMGQDLALNLSSGAYLVVNLGKSLSFSEPHFLPFVYNEDKILRGLW